MRGKSGDEAFTIYKETLLKQQQLNGRSCEFVEGVKTPISKLYPILRAKRDFGMSEF